VWGSSHSTPEHIDKQRYIHLNQFSCCSCLTSSTDVHSTGCKVILAFVLILSSAAPHPVGYMFASASCRLSAAATFTSTAAAGVDCVCEGVDHMGQCRQAFVDLTAFNQCLSSSLCPSPAVRCTSHPTAPVHTVCQNSRRVTAPAGNNCCWSFLC